MYFKIRDNCKSEKEFCKVCRSFLCKHNAGLWTEYLDRVIGSTYARRIRRAGKTVMIDKAMRGHYISYRQDEHSVRRHIIYKWNREKKEGYFFLYDVEMG